MNFRPERARLHQNFTGAYPFSLSSKSRKVRQKITVFRFFRNLKYFCSFSILRWDLSPRQSNIHWIWILNKSTRETKSKIPTTNPHRIWNGQEICSIFFEYFYTKQDICWNFSSHLQTSFFNGRCFIRNSKSISLITTIFASIILTVVEPTEQNFIKIPDKE